MTRPERMAKASRVTVAVCGLLAAASIGCGGLDPADDTARRGAAITDGEPSDGHRAVGWLSMQGAYSLCTATLIGERTVLTAAHCLVDLQVAKLFFGDRGYGVASWQSHPAFATRPFRNDVAVLTLAVPVTDVAAIPLPAGPPAVEQEVTLVGFGVTDAAADDEGVKRVATNRIAEVTDLELSIEGSGDGRGNSCAGDSGGPLLAADGSQVGIASHGAGGLAKGSCGSEGWYTRVDVFVDWIHSVAGDIEPTPPVRPVPTAPTGPVLALPPPGGSAGSPAGCSLGARPGPWAGSIPCLALVVAFRRRRRRAPFADRSRYCGTGGSCGGSASPRASNTQAANGEQGPAATSNTDRRRSDRSNK